jgi:hypothetical protein
MTAKFEVIYFFAHPDKPYELVVRYRGGRAPVIPRTGEQVTDGLNYRVREVSHAPASQLVTVHCEPDR